MRALRLLLPAVLIALCLWLAGGGEALGRLRGADPSWLALSAAAVIAQTLFSALRWQRTARCLGLPIATGHAVREYFLAQFVNQTVPGGVVGDAARAARSRTAAGIGRAAQAVILERAAGQIGMLALACLGIALAIGETGPRAVLLAGPAAILALGLVVAGGALALRRRWPGADLPEAARRAWLAPDERGVQAGLSLGTAGLNLLGFAAAARATGTVLGPTEVLVLVPPILAAMVLPASIGGWGWREGAAAAVFPLGGFAAGAGLAASLAFGLVVLACALPGAFFLAPAEAPQRHVRAHKGRGSGG